MNLDFSEEQSLLRDSVARFVQHNYSLEKRRTLVATADGFSADHWRSMSELGWLSLPFAEEDGGLGGTAIETMIVMEQFGKGLVVEPYLASVVLAGGALRHAPRSALRDQILGSLMDGSVKLALAYAEEQARFDFNHVSLTARQDGSDYVLHGAKSFVLGAPAADHLIVSARTAGEAADPQGLTLFIVEARNSRVQIEGYPTVDGLRAAEVTFDSARVPAANVLGKVNEGGAILQKVINDGILAVSAEAVGAMEVLYKDTATYTQQRVQFNQHLADFQVLQHRMVDMFVEYELAKSLLYRATMEAAQGAAQAQKSIHALKALVGRTSTFVGEQAVQLHGGMGMTEELHIGHFFKRLLVIDLMFGTGDFHLQKFSS